MSISGEQVKGMAEFNDVWQDNHMDDGHAAIQAGLQAIDEQLAYPEATVSEVYFTDVTLRDGQQQQTNEVSTEQRIDVFDGIVQTGVDRIEIGHLGNKNGDQQLATALVGHIAENEKTNDIYKNVQLQVLFGSQEAEIKEGSQVLINAFREQYPENWQEEMSRRMVVHVYDRADAHLRDTASKPYTMQESAFRVSTAAAHAQDAGFTNFSISGEAASAVTPEDAIQFYRSITTELISKGAEAVNINLPNTYGYSHNLDWNTATMAAFNAAVKYGFNDQVTTSIHAHNDVDNAVSFTMGALVAGIDRVEGTIIGVGERTGNVANIDVAARLLEQSRHQKIREERATKASLLAEHAGYITLQRTVMLDSKIINNLHHWYPVAEKLARIFGPHALYRWHRTAVGNPYAHDNGSGPHDQVMAAAVMDPINHPGDKSYEWALIINNALGRPGTEDIAVGDPDAVDKITVGNYAGGGKTKAIKEKTLLRAEESEINQARVAFRFRKQGLLEALHKGVKIVSG